MRLPSLSGMALHPRYHGALRKSFTSQSLSYLLPTKLTSNCQLATDNRDPNTLTSRRGPRKSKEIFDFFVQKDEGGQFDDAGAATHLLESVLGACWCGDCVGGVHCVVMCALGAEAVRPPPAPAERIGQYGLLSLGMQMLTMVYVLLGLCMRISSRRVIFIM